MHIIRYPQGVAAAASPPLLPTALLSNVKSAEDIRGKIKCITNSVEFMLRY